MSPKMGRPVKGTAKRDKRLEVRLTADEYDTIQETADKNGLSKADLIVKAINSYESEK
ncbi:phage protein [Streptococcus pyogenes]|uniref:ribbon-helix-helix domain-containing protein n=1 Tax=Streptococcus pyogenes TaxID=1314 RepID=UPI0010D54943|nr:CopG family transcriptional regulator [Streptococcus pyogenes]VGQ23756.1 phage protein [Streptococcus pyogenes]VGQ65298.1 phage protein [Streptococcus pyogenes]VGQ67136.1 phage protein [Streptococcus pyogenes]VGU90084.1 phage protein [Streptococcus pyogenes]VGV03796.1 phage protein [Streptococcus pyogenes]